MLNIECPKHRRDVAIDSHVQHLEIFLAMFGEPLRRKPAAKESGYGNSEFVIVHDLVLPRSLPWVVYIRSVSFFLSTTPSAVSRCFLNAFRFLSTMVVFARTSGSVASRSAAPSVMAQNLSYGALSYD